MVSAVVMHMKSWLEVTNIKTDLGFCGHFPQG